MRLVRVYHPATLKWALFLGYLPNYDGWRLTPFWFGSGKIR